MALSNPFLAELADAFGIATEFWDWKGRLTEVTDETVIAILAGMDVDAADPHKAAEALAAVRERPWTRVLPPCVVTEQGTARRVLVHVPHGDWVRLAVRFEEGGWVDVAQVSHDAEPRTVEGRLIGEAAFELPTDLPLGYHRLQATTEAGKSESMLVVSPAFLGFPESLGDKRTWGYSVQLYSITSAESWGLGDLSDLSDLAVWSATQQYAGFVLVNPLHAAEPTPPLEASPYLPMSRRFVNPIYLRPEAVPEYAELDDAARSEIWALKLQLIGDLAHHELIDREPIWQTKIAALRIIFDAGMRPARRMAFNDFLRREGRGLTQFATWCALVTSHGLDFRQWPVELRRPSSPEVAEFAAANNADIVFFAWLQFQATEQLRAAQSAAHNSGMRIGIMNDLAVGVSARSSEAWTYSNLFAEGVSVGAPPDHFNQTGQDWGQAPWRPDRLDDLSYAPFRQMVAGVLRHSGGLRVDHVMGLFRLWWVPVGMPPSQGSYVRYNHEAMVGILALEAHRANALVVGEDLGVVEPWVRDYLRRRGILGTSIEWFEKDEGGNPLPPEAWREYCLASVTTHDLPPTAGYLASEHVRLQHSLGLLTESLDTELNLARAERSSVIAALRDRGLLATESDEVEEIVLAMHRFLVATPSRVLCAALTDAVGDRRTQNQPGTSTEYPNWRVPLSGPDGQPLALEDLYVDERAFRLATVMNDFAAPLRPPSVTTELID
ncbi:4-alpha-glucanotransferase [Propionicimonas sp.]|uniref:4-alpha-glucanotransferase n=1 Tax=Propionicimonas sp. TaxID=1955623 RepID=UPI0017A47378|nr:4-alpha-glucanotransferase [Propionicimonas sp.]MBU3977124.1 4-alpha-glucanotransferase [Actinomycetota bacterium]MBA3020693.1 4-alpha-glucanotransferase [Propionicimonas sp.]MBU3985064.1 4-alpha-glucanotransferase [Actinomycetota bacterium]MBU4006979.1 4-alpha-glucanotransferase [Actinomycetota bacterium]MBU4064732.1 4-alpha-glucanotransferase [Actinomycetota bacterium]